MCRVPLHGQPAEHMRVSPVRATTGCRHDLSRRPSPGSSPWLVDAPETKNLRESEQESGGVLRAGSDAVREGSDDDDRERRPGARSEHEARLLRSPPLVARRPNIRELGQPPNRLSDISGIARLRLDRRPRSKVGIDECQLGAPSPRA